LLCPIAALATETVRPLCHPSQDEPEEKGEAPRGSSGRLAVRQQSGGSEQLSVPERPGRADLARVVANATNG